MERKILDFVIERNKTLKEIINLNCLVISEFPELSETDVQHFFFTRKYMIEVLIDLENKIIVYSMMDWSTFNLDFNYRKEYLLLSREKNDYAATMVNQDKILSDLIDEEVVQKIA